MKTVNITTIISNTLKRLKIKNKENYIIIGIKMCILTKKENVNKFLQTFILDSVSSTYSLSILKFDILLIKS